ncbi:MAG: hypothetical protein AAF768_09455 [Pseudomonadota bacterium]
MTIRNILCAITALSFLTVPAVADEMWSTEIGVVLYEVDLPNGDAVWSYPLENTEWRGTAVLVDFAGSYNDRTTYTGYWIEPASADGVSGCSAEMRDPFAEGTSDVWGRLIVSFIEPGTWVALRGDCFDEPEAMLVGTPYIPEE